MVIRLTFANEGWGGRSEGGGGGGAVDHRVYVGGMKRWG